MATIAPTKDSHFPGGVVFKWETVTEADTCAGAAIPSMGVGSVSATGTWGSATMVMQGSIDGGTTWVALKDLDGTAISITANGGATVSAPFLLVRPSFSGGTGQDVDVLLAIAEQPKRYY